LVDDNYVINVEFDFPKIEEYYCYNWYKFCYL